MLGLSPAQVDAVYDAADRETQQLVFQSLTHPYYTFQPRPDSPEEHDEQTGYLESRALISICVGGNGCLGAEQPIFNPVTGESIPVGDIDGDFHVLSRSSSGEVRCSAAMKPFIKGTADIYRVSLSNGESFTATLEHRVLTADNTWTRVGQLQVGDSVLGAASASSKITAFEYLRTDVFYDLHVPGDNNYLAAGVWHHNSGKTVTSAHKCAQFVLEKQPAPRKDTPFWIVSNTYDMVCGVCWAEKLFEIIPKQCVDWDRIQWYRPDRNWPFAVPLKPWPGQANKDKNWVLEFKSYEQGRMSMQARSIGGLWFSEQFTWEIFTEALRGCRDYMYPGSVFAEFTPIDPALSVEIEDRYDDPPQGYSFYRTNTERNVEFKGISRDWYDTFMATVSDEMKETRRTGAFASYEGSIYQTFNSKVHLVESIDVARSSASAAEVLFTGDPGEQPTKLRGIFFRRATDWGFSKEHPWVTLWGFKDGTGRWFIYDEYWSDAGRTAKDHFEAIKSDDRHQYSNEPWFGPMYGDPSRPDLIQQANDDGILTFAARNDVDEGIECVRRHLKIGINGPSLFIDKHRCPKLAQQMRTYRWMKRSGKGINPAAAAGKPLKFGDDAADAVRYLLYSDSQPPRGQVFEPIQTQRQYGRHGVNLHANRTNGRNRLGVSTNGNGRH